MAVSRPALSRSRAALRALALAGAVLLLTACASEQIADPTATDTDAADPTTGAASPTAASSNQVEEPGPLNKRLLPADLLVFNQEELSEDNVRAISKVKGIDETLRMSMAQLAIEERILNLVAADPGEYRRYTPEQAAQSQTVWDRVAGGEMAITSKVGKRFQDDEGYLRLGNSDTAEQVHIGAYAPQVNQIDAVVNEAWGGALNMPEGNAMLISTGKVAPQLVQKRLNKVLGDQASVQILGPNLDVNATQNAVLTGTSVAKAVGSFSYTVLGGGRVAPQQSWINANIVKADVPILGNVTCHKAVIPQLRAALKEIATRGLAAEINPDDYAGCYNARFIAGTTQLSLHTFGIALDINASTNGRGIKGDMHPDVVSIFKRWGFAWGGDWRYTDPMHFEMNRVVNPG